MRISLQDRHGTRHSRGSRRTKPRVPSRRFGTLDTSLPEAQFVTRARPKPASPKPERRQSTQHRQGLQVEAVSNPRPKIRWRVLLLRTAALGVLLLTLGAIVHVSTAGDFYVYDHGTVVQGNQYIDRSLVYQAAGVDEMNIFWVYPDKVAERVRAVDGIKAASVRCGLPARVVISVTERQPVVRWETQGQPQKWWVDEEGVVLPYAAISSTTVSVVDASRRQLKPGDHVTPEGIVQSVLRLAESLPSLQVVYYQDDRGLSFTQRTGAGEWPVYVGDSADLPRKIQVLQALTEYLRTNGIRPSYIDVRWADYPVYGKAASQVAGGGD